MSAVEGSSLTLGPMSSPKTHGRFAVKITTKRKALGLPTHRPPTHPGEMLLEEFLKPLGMSQAAAARRLGVSTNRLNEIIHGKRGITADSALRLSELLKTRPQFWMSLQNNWDLWHALVARRVA